MGEFTLSKFETIVIRRNIRYLLTLYLSAFRQTLFGAVFVSVGENVLDTQLTKRLIGIPGITSELIKSTGATDILDTIPTEYHTLALEAYNDSLRVVFQVALCMACLAILGAVGMEWHTVKKKVPPKNTNGGQEAPEAKAEEAKAEEAEAEATAINAVDGEKYEDRDAAVVRRQ